MKVNQLGIIALCIILLFVGWVMGIHTEQYLIEKGIHQLKNGKVEYVKRQVYNDSIKNSNDVGNEYLQDSCYDSTFKHIAKEDYEKQVGG